MANLRAVVPGIRERIIPRNAPSRRGVEEKGGRAERDSGGSNNRGISDGKIAATGQEEGEKEARGCRAATQKGRRGIEKKCVTC